MEQVIRRTTIALHPWISREPSEWIGNGHEQYSPGQALETSLNAALCFGSAFGL